MTYIDPKTRKLHKQIRTVAFTFVLIVLGGWVFAHLVFGAIDSKISQQSQMLCHSAKVSGNEEYLQKCLKN